MKALAAKLHTTNLYVNVEIDGRRRVIKFVDEQEMKLFGELLLELAQNRSDIDMVEIIK